MAQLIPDLAVRPLKAVIELEALCGCSENGLVAVQSGAVPRLMALIAQPGVARMPALRSLRALTEPCGRCFYYGPNQVGSFAESGPERFKDATTALCETGLGPLVALLLDNASAPEAELAAAVLCCFRSLDGYRRFDAVASVPELAFETEVAEPLLHNLGPLLETGQDQLIQLVQTAMKLEYSRLSRAVYECVEGCDDTIESWLVLGDAAPRCPVIAAVFGLHAAAAPGSAGAKRAIEKDSLYAIEWFVLAVLLGGPDAVPSILAVPKAARPAQAKFSKFLEAVYHSPTQRRIFYCIFDEVASLRTNVELVRLLQRALPIATRLGVGVAVLRRARQQLARAEQAETRRREEEAAAEAEEAQRDASFAELGCRIKVPAEFCCPISTDKMDDPVVASDGHSYDRASIEPVLAGDLRSPLTREALEPVVYPNRNLRKRILEYDAEVLAIARAAVAHGKALGREEAATTQQQSPSDGGKRRRRV